MIKTQKEKTLFKNILFTKVSNGYSVDLAIIDFMNFYISDDANIHEPMYLIKRDFQEWLDLPFNEKAELLYKVLALSLIHI